MNKLLTFTTLLALAFGILHEHEDKSPKDIYLLTFKNKEC